MDRRRAREVAVALLAVVAVALVAVAAVPVFSQDQGAQQPPAIDRTTDGAGDVEDGGPRLPIGTLVGALLVFGLIVMAVQFASEPWETLKLVLAGAVFVGGALWFTRLIQNLDAPEAERNVEVGSGNPAATPSDNASTGFGSGSTDPLALPVEGIATLAIVVVVVGVVALLAWRREELRSALGIAADAAGPDPDADLDAVGRIAGDAADRIEDATTPAAADNAIYRAWREMVALLDAPDPQSGTPRQFAVAGVEAGMDPDDVTVLTRTFEEVRYGGAELSEDRRERAVAALRRIEATHGDRSDEADQNRSPEGDDADRRPYPSESVTTRAGAEAAIDFRGDADPAPNRDSDAAPDPEDRR